MSSRQPRSVTAGFILKTTTFSIYLNIPGKCYYCERVFTLHSNSNYPLNQNRDHIYPVSRGGHKADRNMVYSCVQCNRFKSNYTPEEFYKILSDLRKSQHGFRHYSNESLLIAIRNTKVLVSLVKEFPKRYISDKITYKGISVPNPPKLPEPEKIQQPVVKRKDYPKVLNTRDEQRLKLLLSHPEPNFHY